MAENRPIEMIVTDEEIANWIDMQPFNAVKKYTMNQITAVVQIEKTTKIVREEIAAWLDKWGHQYCIEHIQVEVPLEMGGGMVIKQRRLRRRCRQCWEELVAKLKQGILGDNK
jgi:hypothetical protein